jgi:hypothetical protein
LESSKSTLFGQNTRVGVPKHFRATRRFRRHMRHLAPLAPGPSIDCAYFLSPRGCTRRSHYPLLTAHDPRFCGPFVFILLQIPFPATPFLSHPYKTPGGVRVHTSNSQLCVSVLCGKSRVLRTLQPLCRLFAFFSALAPFVFKSLQPLLPKHPGGGGHYD